MSGKVEVTTRSHYLSSPPLPTALVIFMLPFNRIGLWHLLGNAYIILCFQFTFLLISV